MLNDAKLILEHNPNPEIQTKMDQSLKELNYNPNRIAYKQKIVSDLYKYKKYYLD